MNTFQTTTGREDIDPFGQMMGKSVPQKVGDCGTGGDSRIRNEPGVAAVLSNEIVLPDFPIGAFLVENPLELDKTRGEKKKVVRWG